MLKITNSNNPILLSVSYVFNIILTQQCFYLVSHIFYLIEWFVLKG